MKRGRKVTKKHRENIGKALKGNTNVRGKSWKVKDTSKYKRNTNGFKKGDKTQLGKHWILSEATKKKQSKNACHLNKKESLHPSWKGGIEETRKRNILKKRIHKENLAGRKKPERCEICGRKGIICFDHNHETGEFRGWICNRCNRTLGFVKDSPELLISLAEYIKNNESI